jgi:hypothetical protein
MMTGLGSLFDGWRSEEGKGPRGTVVYDPQRTENAFPILPAALSGSRS